eukprot:5994364-Alexandrium_andersonii.AAC.1
MSRSKISAVFARFKEMTTACSMSALAGAVLWKMWCTSLWATSCANFSRSVSAAILTVAIMVKAPL